MIQYFATHRHLYAIEDFLDTWAPELRREITVKAYEKFSFRNALPGGTCIFSDFERLLPQEFSFVTQLSRRLQNFPDRYAVLNDPSRYLNRFQLLKVLEQRGINQFGAYRLKDMPANPKFPVFVRWDFDHRGALSGLLSSRKELDGYVASLSLSRRWRQERLMVIEYCHCADADGIFRKYSAMNLGGTLVPRHVLFSRDWETKTPDLVDVSTANEERKFVEQFPHQEKLAEVFRIAGIDYGRIDYGIKDGRIQVWEINTNPMVMPRREKIDPRRLEVQAESSAMITRAFQNLARLKPPEPDFPFRSAAPFSWRITQLLGRVYTRR
jgi:hypothetical protein